MSKKFTVRDMAMIGVLTALVFAASWISINIPTPINSTRIHLGNVMCLLSGLILGPIPGGIAAGLGSMFFDFTNPLYISSAPFTLVFKFLMAFVCGKVARVNGAEACHTGQNILAAFLGQFTYVVLYLGKGFAEDYFFLRAELETVLIDVGTKAVTSGINGVIAVIVAVPLAAALRVALKRRHQVVS
jgi:uncharacterized membrane protein